MKDHLRHFWKAYAWCMVITVLSFLPVDNTGPDWFDFQHADKVLHVLFYGILAFLILWGIQQSSGSTSVYFKALVFSLIIIFAYGSILEFVQHYLITSRVGDKMDVLFNLIGWAIASTLFSVRTSLISRKGKS